MNSCVTEIKVLNSIWKKQVLYRLQITSDHIELYIPNSNLIFFVKLFEFCPLISDVAKKFLFKWKKIISLKIGNASLAFSKDFIFKIENFLEISVTDGCYKSHRSAYAIIITDKMVFRLYDQFSKMIIFFPPTLFGGKNSNKP